MGENKGKCTALSSRQLYLLTISGTMNCLGPCSLHWVRGEAQMAGLHSWRMPKHQVTGASWILWSTFSLFSQVSCTHSILFRAASVRMCGQCWSRQPGFLDKEVLLRGRRYRASPGPRGNQLETPLCLEPRQDASCSVRGTGRSHRNSRPSGTAPRGLPPSLAWTSISLRPTAIPRQETRISSAPGQSNLAVPSVQRVRLGHCLCHLFLC